MKNLTFKTAIALVVTGLAFSACSSSKTGDGMSDSTAVDSMGMEMTDTMSNDSMMPADTMVTDSM